MKISNKTILIFEYSVEGHRLEYIHHLHSKALTFPKTNFVFVLPHTFADVKHKLDWPASPNIEFDLFVQNAVKGNSALITSFKNSILLNKFIRKHNASHVVLIALMPLMPFLPFIVSRKIKISGIIYLIYLYRWRESKWFVKIQDVVKYYLFANVDVFENVFILNDPASARYLNMKLKTKKFLYLPDPYNPTPEDRVQNLRKKLNILSEKKVFLHFGGLSRRKGTLDILEAIGLLSTVQLECLCFIFAGKVYDDIKEEFYGKLNKQKHRVQILCFDEFCEYSFLGSLCVSCDFILIPYKSTEQSSGVLGFAAQFNKPVIAPGSKLLGKLVERYGLGFTLKETNSNSLAEFFQKSSIYEQPKYANKYITQNNIENFTNIIFGQII